MLLASGQSLRNAERSVVDFNFAMSGHAQLMLMPTQVEAYGFDYPELKAFCEMLTFDFGGTQLERGGGGTITLSDLFSVDGYPKISISFFMEGRYEREYCWRIIAQKGDCLLSWVY